MIASPHDSPIALVNCVNYFYHTSPRRGIHLSQWQRTHDGMLLQVVKQRPDLTEADHRWWENIKRVPADWMPLDQQTWMHDNIQGMWFFEITKERSKEALLVVTFEMLHDAVLFKLCW